MKSSLRILIAAETAAHAEAVATALAGEFDDIVVSIEPGRFVADFDHQRAPLCVLAFDRLAKVEQYLQELERSSESLHAFAHRRLVLCSDSEVARTYELCLQGRFDDYVLFWPVDKDARRLSMAVHHAARELQQLALRSQRQRAWLQEVQGLQDLETRVSASGAWVVERVDSALDAVQQLQTGVAEGAPDLDRRFEALRATMGWMRHWALRLSGEWHAELASVGRLRALAGRARPSILTIDDDEFQHKLLRRLLGDEEVDLLFASSVTDAMAMLQVQKPDCILMDIGLPDLDGIDAVRMIRSVGANASIEIVMMTGTRDESAVQRSLDAGATGFIAKPFNRAMLLSRLRGVLPGNDSAG
jgi:CheY-like chemotaxis protein